MAQLEEPGWPNLPNQAGVFPNAFALGAQINLAKNKLTEQLKALNQKMYFEELEHERKISQMDIMAALRTKDINERAYAAEIRADIARGHEDDYHARWTDEHNKNIQRDADRQMENEYAKAVNSIDAKPGTQEWQNKFDLINSETDALSTARGKSIHDMAWDRHKTASDQGHKYADFVRKNYQTTIEMATRGKGGVTPYDLQQSDDVWGTGKDSQGNSERWLAYDKKTGELVSPSDVHKAKAGTYGFRTIRASDYDNIRDMQKRMKEIAGSGDLGDRPAVTGTPMYADQAPRDPSKRTVGSVYETPKGPLRWTGEQWVNP